MQHWRADSPLDRPSRRSLAITDRRLPAHQLSFMWLKARVKRLANGPGQCREATSDWWVTRDPMVPRICTCNESNPLQGQMDVQLQDYSYDFALCSPPAGS